MKIDPTKSLAQNVIAYYAGIQLPLKEGLTDQQILDAIAEHADSLALKLACHDAGVHVLNAGQKVKFTFVGRRYVGVVNRVTKRATVLVPHSASEPSYTPTSAWPARTNASASIVPEMPPPQ